MFLHWINTPPKSASIFALKATLLALITAGVGITIAVTVSLATERDSIIPDWQGLRNMEDGKKVFMIIGTMIFIPLGSILEELIFRAPLSIVGKVSPGKWAPIVSAVISSVIFGYIHGGFATIFMQGVTGIILSFAYLKAGGQHGKFWKPMGVSILIHTLFNWVVMGIGGTLMIVGMFLE